MSKFLDEREEKAIAKRDRPRGGLCVAISFGCFCMTGSGKFRPTFGKGTFDAKRRLIELLVGAG
jgi:hypothetical protein